jgi:DNA-3-methyladenine glycosylase II
MRQTSEKMNKQIVNQKDIERLIKTDKIFADIAEKYGNPSDRIREPGFISLSGIILGQRVSLASANAHFLKLNAYLNEFTPSAILSLTDEEMKSCHISRQKAKCLRELSMAVVNDLINLEKLEKLHESEIRKQLTSINGIGDWTADIYMMFCLQSGDIFPIGDIALINTVKELYNAGSKKEIIVLSEKWRPLRSLAAYFLWHYYLNKRQRVSSVNILV